MKREKVILVEDCKVQGSITKDVLQKSGYETMWVQTSEKALENNLFMSYDIAILDVILPGIDGYECCKIIKESNNIMPIIMLTSMEDEESVIKALECGADDYIKKPHSNQEFIARVKVQLRTSRLQKELIEKNNELQMANKLIKDLATTDILTGANNRAYIPEYINNIIRNCKEDVTKISTIMIDIDNFKTINDNHGHMVGDTVLKKVSSICKSQVEKNGIVVRFGGEEFLIVISNNTEKSVDIAENIRRICEESLPCGLMVTISIGVYTGVVPIKGIMSEFERCIKEADNRLYISKRAGKNKVTFE